MKFTPLAAIFTSASFGFGSGTGTSASVRTSGPPGFWMRIAFMAHSVHSAGVSRRTWIVAIAIAAVVLGALVFIVTRAGMPPPVPTPPGSFSFGVFGDAPYFPGEALQYPILLKHIDAHDLSFVIHVGDIFWGPCSDKPYAKVLRNFNRLHEPVIYTPGDNEWTDCWERGSGGDQPRERLARIRQIFFANPNRSLGAHTIPLVSEGGEFVENARWSHDGDVFTTLDLPGSRNGMEPFP